MNQRCRSNVSLFINSITTIDCSFLDFYRGIVGQSWIVDVSITGHQDAQGMLMDFADVKRSIKTHIDRSVDHAFLVPSQLPVLHCDAEVTRLHLITATNEMIDYEGPVGAATLISTTAITANAVACHLQQLLLPLLSDNIVDLMVRLRPESIDGPYYHYSHGLKHHLGNCQRIVHGHRSAIVVRRNGVRDNSFEQNIAMQFKDIYLGLTEDVEKQFRLKGNDYLRFAYQSSQGAFALSLAKSRCYLLNVDTTVENIALHLAHQYATLEPGIEIEVEAFEGVNKGAMAKHSVNINKLSKHEV